MQPNITGIRRLIEARQRYGNGWTSRRLEVEFADEPLVMTYNDSGPGAEVPEFVAVPHEWSKRQVVQWVERMERAQPSSASAYDSGTSEEGDVWAVWLLTW